MGRIWTVLAALLVIATAGAAPAEAKKKLQGSIAIHPVEFEANSTFTETETFAADPELDCEIYHSGETGTGTMNVSTGIKRDPKNPNGFITFGNPGKDLGFLIVARESLAPAFSGTTSATVTTTAKGCTNPPPGSADANCVPTEPYEGDPGYTAKIEKVTKGGKLKGVAFKWIFDYAPGFSCDYVNPYDGFTEDAVFQPPQPTECTSRYSIKSIKPLLKNPDTRTIDLDCTDSETFSSESRSQTKSASLDAQVEADFKPVKGPR